MSITCTVHGRATDTTSPGWRGSRWENWSTRQHWQRGWINHTLADGICDPLVSLQSKLCVFWWLSWSGKQASLGAHIFQFLQIHCKQNWLHRRLYQWGTEQKGRGVLLRAAYGTQRCQVVWHPSLLWSMSPSLAIRNTTSREGKS